MNISDADRERVFRSVVAVGQAASGFLLRESEASNRVLLATNFHVLQGWNPGAIMSRHYRTVMQGGTYRFEGSEECDICVAIVPEGMVNPDLIRLTVSDIECAVSGTVAVVGAGWPNEKNNRIGDPFNHDPELVFGTVDQTRITVPSVGGGVRYGMRTDALLTHGHSGSPIFKKDASDQIKVVGMYSFVAQYNHREDVQYSACGLDIYNAVNQLLE